MSYTTGDKKTENVCGNDQEKNAAFPESAAGTETKAEERPKKNKSTFCSSDSSASAAAQSSEKPSRRHHESEGTIRKNDEESEYNSKGNEEIKRVPLVENPSLPRVSIDDVCSKTKEKESGMMYAMKYQQRALGTSLSCCERISTSCLEISDMIPELDASLRKLSEMQTEAKWLQSEVARTIYLMESVHTWFPITVQIGYELTNRVRDIVEVLVAECKACKAYMRVEAVRKSRKA